MTAARDAAGEVDLRVPEEIDRRPGSAGLARELAQEWPARAFFGVLLAALAVAATIAGGFWFAAMLAIAASAAAREWHRMVGGEKYAFETFFTITSILAGLIAVLETRNPLWPAIALGSGAVLVAITSFRRGTAAARSGSGVIYIGAAALSLMALRVDAAHGMWVVIGLFLTIWAADTGAFVSGRVLGGPRLIPSLSPNKTWSGIAGGIVFPAAALGFYVSYLHGDGWRAALLGAVLAVAGHAGDLFESWVKRRVGRKNSGGLIPGHGGVLDRIDSTLFVAPLAAILIFVFGLDPLFGAHP